MTELGRPLLPGRGPAFSYRAKCRVLHQRLALALQVAFEVGRATKALPELLQRPPFQPEDRVAIDAAAVIEPDACGGQRLQALTEPVRPGNRLDADIQRVPVEPARGVIRAWV